MSRCFRTHTSPLLLLAALSFQIATHAAVGEPGEDYHAARDAGVEKVLTDYLEVLEELLAGRLEAADLDGATEVKDEIGATKQWLLQEKHADFKELPEGLPQATTWPPLWEVFKEMRTRLIRGLTTLNQRSFEDLEVVQKQRTKAGDLEGALEVREFRQQLSNEIAKLTGDADQIASAGLPPEPVDLLDESQRKHWRVIRGDWTFRKETLIGEGNSRIAYEQKISPPFELTFGQEVEEGQRPRLYFGKMVIQHDGYDFALRLHPKTEPKKVHPYARDRKLRIKLIVDPEFVELHVNDRLLERRETRIAGPLDRIEFSGGDGWSPGRTDFTDIFLLERPAQ
ncbi:MAG: hypothetical protein P1U85_05535 [Verrucomicrobiales bacterium]|nr:hypothetical protein [Verrucomicrobiales bacterium]